MLTPIAVGVLAHESAFLQSNTVIVQGREGVLLVDPGITADELDAIADELDGLGQPVVAAFSTHPHWDHALWHERFGDAPRYGTARGAAVLHSLLARPEWEAFVADRLPPELSADIPLDLFGRLTALPPGVALVPWDGPLVRIIEHRAHAAGHAALLVEQSGVLIAGDMLSDTLIPFLDGSAVDPAGDYLTALDLFEAVAAGVDTVVPGHGSVGSSEQFRERLRLDRTYVSSLRDGTDAQDFRLGPTAPLGWLADVHDAQVRQLANADGHESPSA